MADSLITFQPRTQQNNRSSRSCDFVSLDCLPLPDTFTHHCHIVNNTMSCLNFFKICFPNRVGPLPQNEQPTQTAQTASSSSTESNHASGGTEPEAASLMLDSPPEGAQSTPEMSSPESALSTPGSPEDEEQEQHNVASDTSPGPAASSTAESPGHAASSAAGSPSIALLSTTSSPFRASSSIQSGPNVPHPESLFWQWEYSKNANCVRCNRHAIERCSNCAVYNDACRVAAMGCDHLIHYHCCSKEYPAGLVTYCFKCKQISKVLGGWDGIHEFDEEDRFPDFLRR